MNRTSLSLLSATNSKTTTTEPLPVPRLRALTVPQPSFKAEPEPAYSLDQVQQVPATTNAAKVSHCERRIAHFEDRLGYDRSIPEEQGGLVDEHFESLTPR